MSHTITRQRSFASDDHAVSSVRHSRSPNRIDRIQSPVVEGTQSLLKAHKFAASHGKWCLINLALCILFYFGLLGFARRHVWQTALPLHLVDQTLSTLFLVNCVYNLYCYLASQFKKRKVELTEEQKTLLGVSKECGKLFQTPSKQGVTTVSATPISRTPSSYPMRRSSSRISPSVQSTSPGRLSQHSPSRYSPGRTPLTAHSSSMFSSPIGQNTLYRNVSASSSINLSQNSSPSIYMNSSHSQSPSFRGTTPSPSRRSVKADDDMMDVDKVDEFVRKEEQLDQRTKRASESPKSFGKSLWSYGRAAYDFIPFFGTYHLATRTQTKSSKDNDDSQNPVKYEEICRKLMIKSDDLNKWTENIRKWIAETVLEKLVAEMKEINKKLTQMGCPECQIGTSNIATLKLAATSRAQHIPTLSSIIPYLDLTTNQAYLFTRLNELATGGCLRLFKWDEGGLCNGQAWHQELPTDSQIIAHLFCTYMDMHLPGNPRYAEGKSFTGLHFLKTPDTPENKLSKICIYQSKTQKPHFKVLIEDETYDIPQGRNNLFYALAVFLHFVKKKNHGMLERVNLGMSGINILWILEK